ncbi:hypothetical protein ACFSR7_01470 [Cohnella sp. GCM10020058]|uniref:hypothetical protein n=1 Tax=Cohnella sp. GCM10020058 TaxID=3317330 RepID=UPI0036338AA8
MQSHGVKLYAELYVNAKGKRRYSAFEGNEIDLFAGYFDNTAYHSFFFSGFDIKDLSEIKQFGYFYDAPSSASIEVKGGRETDQSRELIQMRMISKAPDKRIQAFYRTLQKDFKKMPDLQKHAQKHYFYLPTEKTIIPANSQSQYTRDRWEDFCLSKIERAD